MVSSTTRSLAGLAAGLVLVAAGATGASADEREALAGSTAPAAAAEGGIRDTDAPVAVRVGAAAFAVPVTVITASGGADSVVVELGYAETHSVGYGYAGAAEPGRPTVWKPRVETYADDLVAWGRHDWFVEEVGLVGAVLASAQIPTDVRAHSLAGLRTSRADGALRVEGSVRGYHSVQDRYVPLPGRTLSVQRWTGTAWVQATGVTTDARGNFATSAAQVAAGTPLRVVVQDAATVWGAVSATVRAD